MAGGSVRTSGPLFDGRAAEEIRKGTEAIRRDLAREGERLAVSAFSSMIRANTGRFLSSITSTSSSRSYSTHGYTLPVVVDSREETVVTTDLATYGPWLEGTGSRNETTRFKGYHGFRQAAQELSRSAQAIADRTIQPFIRRCN